MLLNFPLQKTHTTTPIIFMVLMIAMHLLEPYSSEWFGFYIEKVMSGEWWRIVSGQLLHTNTNHLLLNLSGLLLIWALHGEHYSARHLALSILLHLVLIGILLVIFADYGHYAGFSGVLHGLLIYGAIIDIIKQDKTGWLLLVGVSAKVAYENVIGASEETEELIGAAVATEAHLIGIIAGCLIALSYFYYQSMSKK